MHDQACDDVSSGACAKADDHAHRPRWIGLRPCDPRNSRRRESAHGQLQKIAAKKFHDVTPRVAAQCARGTLKMHDAISMLPIAMIAISASPAASFP
jgi:hypothetical protein